MPLKRQDFVDFERAWAAFRSATREKERINREPDGSIAQHFAARANSTLGRSA